MQVQKGQTPMKNVFQFNLKKEPPIPITIRSDFDSGNAGKVELGINNMIIITPAFDCSGTIFQSHAKGWFYFGVKGLPIQYKQKFVIKKMTQLSSQSKFSEYFKPVYRYAGQQWGRVENAITFVGTEANYQRQRMMIHNCILTLSFKRTVNFPFSFQECQKMLKGFHSQFKSSKTIYYKDEIIIRSPQGRPLHLLTISSHDQKLAQKESIINQNLFDSNSLGRSHKFDSNKKVVLITARVHPGQAPASHTMNGILKFILSKDARAHTLRKNYVFKIVPMINPDGVYHGHYRMDIFNQNLNRYYLNPDAFRHPSAFAICSIGEYYRSCDKLAFYIDLHAHPQKKGNFIYGNSLQNQQEQIQTQLFPKLLALNCVQFDYENSSFAKKQMSSKDKNDELTKQGCGRVVFNKVFGQVYAYTLQCGYTMSTYFNELTALTNPHRKIEKHGIIPDDIQNVKSKYYDKQIVYFTIRSYENLGKNILISILDLFDKNIYSRIPNTPFKDLNGVRKEIGTQLNKNKQYKVYAKGLIPMNLGVSKIPQMKKPSNNSSYAGKSVTKKSIIIKSHQFKSEFDIKVRNRTLPKMNK